MKRIATAYLFSFFAFLAIDYIWLTELSPAFYAATIGDHMADSPNLWAAAGFYVMYIGGITGFAVLASDTLKGAGLRGFFFGLVAYGTYDMTALAAFKDWPLIVTVADMAWGAVLTGLTALVSYWAVQKVTPQP